MSHALATLDSVEPPKEMRMADAAHWIVACEPVSGFAPGTFIETMVSNQEETAKDRIVNHPLVVCLLEIFNFQQESRTFSGTMGQLHSKIHAFAENKNGLPKTASHLSNALKRLKPGMKTVGLHVEIGEHSRRGREVTLSFDPEKTE